MSVSVSASVSVSVSAGEVFFLSLIPSPASTRVTCSLILFSMPCITDHAYLSLPTDTTVDRSLSKDTILIIVSSSCASVGAFSR